MEGVTKLQLNQQLMEEFKNSAGTAAWTNPQNKKVYMHHSTDPELFPFDKRERFVIDVSAFNKFIDLNDQGKLSESEYKDKINFAIWNEKDGWDEKAKIWLSNTGAAEDVQGIKPADYSGLENTVVEAIIYGMSERARSAQNALKVVNLSDTIRIYPEVTSRVNVLRNIDFTQDIPIQSMGLKTTTLNLKCDAASFAIYDHTNWRPRSIDVLRTNIEGFGLAFIRDQADQVVTLLTDTAITAITGTDWGVSTNNPYLDIAKAQKVINDNHGLANKVIMNEIAWAVMRGNPNTKALTDTSNIQQSGSRVMNGDIFVNAYTNYIDNGLANNIMTVWDNDFVEWNQGPMGTVTDRENKRFRNVYIRFSWNLPNRIDGGKIRRVTGINTVP